MRLGPLLGLTLFASLAQAGSTCVDDALIPSDVQGVGDASPLVGQTVTVEGVLTVDSRQPDGWQGFYLQSPPNQADNDPRTSDALFVYTDRDGGRPGQQLQVTGRVKEFHGLTELTRVSRVTVCGSAPLPEPVTVDLPWPDQRPPEHLENMRVRFRQPLTLISPYSFIRYGELVLSHRAQVIPTEFLEPGAAARDLAQRQALNRVTLDDGRSLRDPRPLPWPAPLLANGLSVRTGDRIDNLVGVLDYRFGQWRLQPTTAPNAAHRKPRPEAPAKPADASLRVVTLNLGNFFNGDGAGKGFDGGRGARTQAQFNAQTQRLVAALTALEPDILAAVEMENDGYGSTSAIADLARALGPGWRYVRTPGGSGSDAIRTDLLYRSDRAETVGEPQRLTAGPFARQGRPPLAQRFRPLAGSNQAAARSVRIVVPHFKSKGCGGATGADRDQNDGQGCYAQRRIQEADALADWLKSLSNRASAGDLAGTLVTGDLNSYAREWPIQRLEQAGLTNLVRAQFVCEFDHCQATTFLYRGRQGSLDYALASDSLRPYVLAAGVWPINAEEFPALGYQGALAIDQPIPWRSSDHNPVFVDLAL